MKQYVCLLTMIFVTLCLISCATTNVKATLKQDLTLENWQASVARSPKPWLRGADSWFLTGRPTSFEVASHNAPYNSAISTMNVRVPNFTKVKLNGDFQVQLFGATYGHNTVYVYGPNVGVRNVIVEMQGDTLCVTQIPGAPGVMQSVIVRIGVQDLRLLVQDGCGLVEGVHITSGCLDIMTGSGAMGNIFLSGSMNVRKIIKGGGGTINIFGAITPDLCIETNGGGAVNVSGNVGVSNILHHGNADINVIGANSDSLKIVADGGGKISINGPVCLKEVRASEGVCVLVNMVNSDNLSITTSDKARVGLAGQVNTMYADASNNSYILGRYLCATEAFVRAHDNAHINVTASNKIFASGTDNGSVYFYGSPNVLSQFVSGKGVVIPIYGVGYASCPVPKKIYNIKSAKKVKAIKKVKVTPYIGAG